MHCIAGSEWTKLGGSGWDRREIERVIAVYQRTEKHFVNHQDVSMSVFVERTSDVLS